MNPNFLVECPF